MRIAVTGATGTIGRAVCRDLQTRGAQVVALSRNRSRARQALGGEVEVHAWVDPARETPPVEALAGADAVIHLLGEPVAQRWSQAAKARIRDSRVFSTRMLVAALGELPEPERPTTLVSQSGTGFYGPRDDRQLDESAPPGSDFLAQVVRQWESEAAAARDLARVVMTRTGVVLSPAGGALEKMLPFFRLGLGGPVAGGRQYVPWIHLDDVAAGLVFCAQHAELAGPINLTAPVPVTNAELAAALGRVLHRPAVLPVPALALRVIYGEMAQIVTTGQAVLPRRLTEAGYEFRYRDLDAALRDVLARV
ncbi:MAG TPA: TIGR01777 family oxidoreductase [Solirubrobacteraceae bacterium]|nr:TIGR01777 family oxidoreductase [Solirubrobacteraceae bacterium]